MYKEKLQELQAVEILIELNETKLKQLEKIREFTINSHRNGYNNLLQCKSLDEQMDEKLGQYEIYIKIKEKLESNIKQYLEKYLELL